MHILLTVGQKQSQQGSIPQPLAIRWLLVLVILDKISRSLMKHCNHLLSPRNNMDNGLYIISNMRNPLTQRFGVLLGIIYRYENIIFCPI